MSLPPARWEEAASLPTLKMPSARAAGLELLLSMVWGARNDGAREPFRARLTHSDLKAHWVHTEDGWSLPLWRCAPRPDGCGTPIVLAGDLCLGPRSMDLNDGRSLVQYFHGLGFDVYVFGHRAGPEAIRPQHTTNIDFDSIVGHDIPAAIRAVRSFSRARRVHWVGHGFGGQCLVGYLAQDGGDDISAGALLSSPVRFEPYKATIRRVAAIAERLPQNWRIPTQRIQEILTVASKAKDLSSLTLRMEGPLARAMLMDTTTDLALGLIRQINNWHKTGHLTDQTNRFDYLEGITDRRARLLVVGSPSDQFCRPEAAKPVFDKIADGYAKWVCLPEGWAHLDLIAGADAARTLFPEVADWLKKHNGRCWTDA